MVMPRRLQLRRLTIALKRLENRAKVRSKIRNGLSGRANVQLKYRPKLRAP